jgi:uncharacterized protein YjbI with pentapeptide repeats
MTNRDLDPVFRLDEMNAPAGTPRFPGVTVTRVGAGAMDRLRWQKLTAIAALLAAACVGVVVAAPTAFAVTRCRHFVPGANLSGCNLSGTNLAGKNLRDANLTKSILIGTILARANLSGAELYKANLTGTNLAYTNLRYVKSGGIIGAPAFLPTNWQLVDGYLVGFRANLTGGNLTGADLTSANLSEAILVNANLTGAILKFANLTRANLSGATLTGVRAIGIIGIPASLPTNWEFVMGCIVGPGANLAGANLIGADLAGADLAGIDLEVANLITANLIGANLIGANLAGVDLYLADLTRADLTGANLGPSYEIDPHLIYPNLGGVIWSNTRCPDGTDSDNDGGTCVNNLG